MMKLSFFSSLFKHKDETLVVPDSLLLKKIKSLSHNSNLIVYANKEIFHHTEAYPIALMIYDNLRGIYIFEIKEWSYDDLKNATASKAQSVENSKNTLAFDKTHTIIKQKFNEILHNDGVEIFNYLLMENLSADEYEHLNESLQEMLPKEKIIFSDSDSSEIFKKLQNAAPEDHALPSIENILGTLFVQYAITHNNKVTALCNEEQTAFIDTRVQGLQNLHGPAKSGKSNILLLQSMKELFKKERQKIILIKPTVLSKDIIHKHFLELLEHAIIEIDLMAFEILTPQELLNKHLQNLKMPLLQEELFIDPKLMQKSFHAAEYIICDDADLLPDTFINYLKHIQKKADLLIINAKDTKPDFSLQKSYRNTKRVISFYQTNPLAKAMHLTAALLQHNNPEEILIVSNAQSREKLQDDLSTFIEAKTVIIEASKHLLEQTLEGVVLVTYNDIIEIEAKHIILMDAHTPEKSKLIYACNNATQTLHILYEEESQTIEELKELYESN